MTEQDRIDADRAVSRDSERIGTGLSPFATRGFCRCCPRKLVGSQEATAGVCTDCQVEAGKAVG